MNFLDELRASIHSPAYYAGLKQKPASYSFSYFFKLITLIALISTCLLLLSIFPAIHSGISTIGAKITDYYPDDLEIKIVNGVASANVPQPYFLALPDELKGDQQSQLDGVTSTPDNLLVIDTQDAFTLDEFRNDKTLLLLTSTSLAYVKDGGVVIQPFDAKFQFTLNKEEVTAFLQKIEPYFRFAYPFITLGLVVGLFLGAALRLIYLFVFALLIWGIAHAKKVSLGYRKSYQLGLHLMTLPMIITAALSLIDQQIEVPLLFTVIALIAAWINIKPEPATPVVSSS